jgi:hypothetical protein
VTFLKVSVSPFLLANCAAPIGRLALVMFGSAKAKRMILWPASTGPLPLYVTVTPTSVAAGAAVAAFDAAAFDAVCFGAVAAWNINSAAAAIGIAFMVASSAFTFITNRGAKCSRHSSQPLLRDEWQTAAAANARTYGLRKDMEDCATATSR